MKPGTIVYFKKATQSLKKGGTVAFIGHAYGMLLGMIPPGKHTPPRDYIVLQMAGQGYVLFDDILEFLGKEVCEDLLKKVGTKYTERLASPKPELKAVPKLLDALGKPMTSGETPQLTI